MLAVTVAVAAVGLASVPNLVDDPVAPPTRLSMLLACLAATATAALAEPLLDLEEQLSSMPVWAVRAAAITLLVVPLVGLVVLLRSATSGALVTGPAGVLMGVMGIALLFSRVNLYLGLLAPWAYAMAGLTLGYERTLGGPSSLKPWAWLVEPEDLTISWWLVALFALGIVAHAVPRR